MNIKTRIRLLERLAADDERPIYIVHRRRGETAEECVAREGIDHPVYVLPPPAPRDENGELAASWVAGCVRWNGKSIEPVKPGFDPRTCDPRLYDPDPDV